MDRPQHRPGTEGERQLQQSLGTQARAAQFYRDQVLDHQHWGTDDHRRKGGGDFFHAASSRSFDA